MSALSIQVPFPVFQDRAGQPLQNGYVWIGEPNLNPQTNPVVAYFDAALTIPAPQPLRTLNGYISRAGTPAQIYVDAVNFSILVQDSKGSMVYNFQEGTGISPDASGVTYDPPFTGGVATTVQDKLAQTVSAKDFGAVGDGVTDDTIALQAWANCGAKNLYWNEGQYLVNASLATALNITVFNFGDVSLKACIVFPAGVTVATAGTATQLIVNNPDATTCGVAINADAGGSPPTHSQIATQIERFILRSNGANGRYGVVTPAAALLLADKRPRYALDVQFAPPPGSDNQTICSYGWDVGIMLGDTVDARVFYAGYGTYNTTLPDAGQHQMVGMKVKAVAGAYGVVAQYQCSNMRTFFEGSDGLEGFVVRDSEGQGCWYGIALTSAGTEPGGYIDNVHTNTNKTAYLLSNRASLQIGMVEAYRSDAYHNHGGEWNGISMDACGKVTIDSLHTIHGTLLTKTGTNAIKATGTSTFICSAMQSTSVDNAVYIDNSPDCIVGNQVVNSINTIFNLNGASTNDFTGGSVMVRAGAPAYLVTDGTVDKKRIRLPLNSGIAVRTYQTITIAATGSTTVKPRETATTFNIVMSVGTGAFTYDLILDRTAAVVGDVVTIHVNGSASTNPTLRVCDNSTATVLDTFNNITGTGRYLAQYIFQESGVSGTWVTLGLMQSVELSF
jgi:hypothetical protein